MVKNTNVKIVRLKTKYTYKTNKNENPSAAKTLNIIGKTKGNFINQEI